MLFGVPGAGKTYVGRVLANITDFHFHDLDQDLPDDMREAIIHKQPVTDAMRDRFYARAIAITRALRAAYPRVAIANTLLKNRHRKQLAAAFPDARFILVKSAPGLIDARFAVRGKYMIDLDDARRMAAAFEPPTLPHHVLQNTDGREKVVRQLYALLEQIEDVP